MPPGGHKRFKRSALLSTHLALQLRRSFSKLSVFGLRKLRVETLRQAAPPALLVFTLSKKYEPLRPVCGLNHDWRLMGRLYLAVHLPHLSGKLDLSGVSELGVQRGRSSFGQSLRTVIHLENTNFLLNVLC